MNRLYEMLTVQKQRNGFARAYIALVFNKRGQIYFFRHSKFGLNKVDELD